MASPALQPVATASPQAAPAAPQTAPASPQTAPAVKPDPVKKYIFPFPGINTVGAKPAEIPTANYVKTWGQYAMNGFYPLGLSGQWHGGIHFDDNTGTQLLQHTGVRCIADGEVIAWRYNAKPFVSEYDEGKGKYSTSFVLVRHRLQYPVPAGGGDPPSCIFYSLYMHLLHTQAYDPAGLLPARPDIWVNITDRLRRVVGRQARYGKRPEWSIPKGFSSREKGKLRDEIGVYLTQQGKNVAWIGSGTKLTLKNDEDWSCEVASIEEGNKVHFNPEVGEIPVAGLHVLDYELDKVPGLPQAGAVHILPEPLPVKAGALIGHPGDYQRFGEVAIRSGEKRLVHLEVFAGQEFKGFVERCRTLDAAKPDKEKSLLALEAGALPKALSSPDLTLPAGEWLGLDPASPKEGDWVLAQRGTNSYSGTDKAKRKAGFTPGGGIAWMPRSDFARSAQDGLWELASAWTDAWGQFPLLAGGDRPPVAVGKVIDLKQKEPLPLALRFADDEHDQRWWLVRYFARMGEKLVWTQGWVSGATAKVKLCTPWAWPGFELVGEDGASPLDRHNQRKADKYDPSTPLLEKLLALIDANGDGVITLKEIRDAWQNPCLVQPLSRLVIEHKSEWGLGMSFWDEVGRKIMEARSAEKLNVFDFVKIWKEERKRIEKLRFWDEVKGQHGFPQDIKVWHVHPLALVENFINKGCGCETLTVNLLLGIEPSVPVSKAQLYVPLILEMYEKYGISSCIGKAHLLAQMLHESMYFKTTIEGGSGHSYSPYIGRGLLQITHRNTYEKYGVHAGGMDFVSNVTAMQKLENVPYCVDVSGWFWTKYKPYRNGIVNLEDYGKEDDFIWITFLVNGGFTHYADRLRLINAAIDKLKLHEHLKKNKDGVYHLEDSFGFGHGDVVWLWARHSDPSEPGLNHLPKDSAQAIMAYRRYLEIGADNSRKNIARTRIPALGGTL
ncbi:MAG: M23 family metallopeptidase [Azoarcus sp.]|jgi:predicted chitinase|nr:M23 family metallopeptidase [Azoarcus sp.]